MCFGQSVDPRPEDRSQAEAIMDGRLPLRTHQVTDLALSPTWEENPYGNANWAFQYQSLSWVDTLRRVHREFGDEEMRERYRFLLQNWWNTNRADINPTTGRTVRGDYRWSDMATAYRTLVYICAIAELGPEPWLIEALEAHGTVLQSDEAYNGRGNHALHQNMSLAAVGYVLGRNDLIVKATRRSVALLERAIDPQGVSLEGSSSYQLRNYQWWTDARNRLTSVGARLGPEWNRLDVMPSVMAHFVAPDGRWVMFGDTVPGALGRIDGTPFQYAVSRGAKGPRPKENIAVLDAGYVLARSSWQFDSPVDDTTFVGLRFGPPMTEQVHGHEDLGNVVFYRGSDRLVEDSGLYGYFGGPLRGHMLSQAAHNVILVDGAGYYRTGRGSLTAFARGDGWIFANVSIGALENATWNRTLIALLDKGILVIDDRVSQEQSRTVTQQWHLEAEAGVTVSGAVVEARGKRTTTLEFLGDRPPAIDVGTAKRSTVPHEAFDVPVVRAALIGSARFTTVISTTPSESELRWRSTAGFRVLVKTDATSLDVTVKNATSADGLRIARQLLTDTAGRTGVARNLHRRA